MIRAIPKTKGLAVTAFRISLILFLLLSILACATTPNLQDITTANYGEPPTNLQDAINAYLKDTLKDPDSLKDLRIGVPKKGWARTNYGKDILYGYWVGYSYNAKNSYGGYVGQKYYCAFFQNGYIKQVWSISDCRLFCHIIE